MDSFLWLLYECGMGLALLLAGPFLLVRRGRHYLPTLAGRLGGAPPSAPRVAGVRSSGGPRSGSPPGRGRLWLHAVSVGEVGVAATLARALPADLDLLVTTVTPTGHALAQRILAERAEIAYLPFDLGPAVARFWRRFSPAALILVEGDYWPLVLREARRRGVPVAVVNGRIGDRSFARMKRLRPLAGRLFAGIGHFGMQTAGDRERLAALGIDPRRVTVTGNLKFDTVKPPAKRDLEAALRRLAAGRPVLVAGSTMAGEEEQVIAAFNGAGGGRRAMLLLAPRHPERWNEVERRLRQSGLEVARRSALDLQAADPEAPQPDEPVIGPALAVRGAGGGPDVVMLDSMGELAALYNLAAAVFIGGTLVATGGHNPVEPARYGVPIAVGPSLHNFREIAEIFDRAGAWQRVDDAAALARAWEHWLADPAAAQRQGDRAANLLRENRGALGRTLEMLTPMLAQLSPRAPATPALAGAGAETGG
jgi:3-deoxy-D-manno-octulosonic-acid transferase